MADQAQACVVNGKSIPFERNTSSLINFSKQLVVNAKEGGEIYIGNRKEPQEVITIAKTKIMEMWGVCGVKYYR